MTLENVLSVLMCKCRFQFPMEIAVKCGGWSLVGLAYRDRTVRFCEEGNPTNPGPSLAVEITDANDNVARMTMTPNGDNYE